MLLNVSIGEYSDNAKTADNRYPKNGLLPTRRQLSVFSANKSGNTLKEELNLPEEEQ
jgi:hypothetical protein